MLLERGVHFVLSQFEGASTNTVHTEKEINTVVMMGLCGYPKGPDLRERTLFGYSCCVDARGSGTDHLVKSLTNEEYRFGQ